LGKAVAAFENGAGGGFMQSSAVPLLRKITISMDLSPDDRGVLSAFLSTSDSQGYDQGGEITGILKQMKDTMEADLAEEESKHLLMHRRVNSLACTDTDSCA